MALSGHEVWRISTVVPRHRLPAQPQPDPGVAAAPLGLGPRVRADRNLDGSWARRRSSPPPGAPAGGAVAPLLRRPRDRRRRTNHRLQRDGGKATPPPCPEGAAPPRRDQPSGEGQMTHVVTQEDVEGRLRALLGRSALTAADASALQQLDRFDIAFAEVGRRGATRAWSARFVTPA